MKPALYVLGGLLVLAVVLWALWSFDPFHRRQRAEERAVAAEQAADLAKETTRITERTITHETVIHDQAAGAVETIHAALGSEDPVPPDVLGAWRSGIDGMRDGSGSADDSGSAHPGQAMPAPLT